MVRKEKDDTPMIVTTKQISEILKLSTRRVGQLAEEGHLVRIGHGKFDLPESIEKYYEFKISKLVGDDSEVDPDLNKLREETLWTRARRQKAELEYKIMTGELHRSEDVEEVMNAMLASFRSQLLAFPTKVAGKVVGVMDIRKSQEILKQEIYDLMQELSDYDPDVFYEKSKDVIFSETSEEEQEVKSVEKNRRN